MAASIRSSSSRLRKSVILSRHLWPKQTYTAYSTVNKVDTYNANDKEDVESLYPPIKPIYPPGDWGDLSRPIAWHLQKFKEEFEQVPTVKERLEKLAGSKTTYLHQLRPFDHIPDSLEVKQYVTNTHVSHSDPPKFDLSTVPETLVAKASKKISKILLEEEEFLYKIKPYENEPLRHYPEESIRDHSIIGKIISRLVTIFGPTSPHLWTSQIDENVRCETCWKRAGYSGKEKPMLAKWYGIAPFQSKCTIDWQIRTEDTLPMFAEKDDCYDKEVPTADYIPSLAGQYTIADRPTSFAGYRLGDPCEFVLLSVVNGDRRKKFFLSTYGEEAEKNRYISAALTTAFTSAVAQAHNQGFNWIIDIEHPMCSQVLITNGNKISFARYQLNTMALWKSAQIPLSNMMWITKEMPLFDTIEDGQVKGLNDEVVKQLVCMLTTELVEKHPPAVEPSREGTFRLDDERVKYPYINTKGEQPIELPKLGRFEVPRNAVYT